MNHLACRLLAVLTSILLLNGCATTLDLSRYKELGIDEQNAAGELPQYIKEKQRPKVAVLPISDTTQYRSSLNLAQAAQDSLTQLIVASGSVEVMERAQLESFMEEMKLKAGVGVDVDPDEFAKIAKDVDTVFVGAIISAGVTASFADASSWTDKKGKTHTTPPSAPRKGR